MDCFGNYDWYEDYIFFCRSVGNKQSYKAARKEVKKRDFFTQ